jgi:hypothetical protein
MKLSIRKRTISQTLSSLIILITVLVGWLYLEYSSYVAQRSFDFSVYLDKSEGTVIQENSTSTNVIVFSSSAKSKPVEIYTSNCPKYSTCTLSITNAYPTYTSELAIEASDSTPAGTYPINVFAASSGMRKATTYYLTVKPIGCTCIDWINEGCGGRCGSQMYLARMCKPRNCDIEFRCAYNFSCIEDFYLESIPNYSEALYQKASFVIRITSVHDFSDFVYLSTSSCPRGSSCSYSPNPVRASPGGVATSLLNVRTALGAVIGEFTITTLGINNGTIRSTNSTIKID